jgi:cytoplasmic iron level regulating protein YaaA (DUF328/UPF0246 family)
MKIVISPAKTLNFTSELPTTEFTKPAFLKESRIIHSVLKQKTPDELAALMDISPKLADLNWQRNQHRNFASNKIKENARQAVYTFNGEVYLGMDAYTIPIDKLEMLQDRLRILSGLYGLLKPLDVIQAYRLEMGTHLQINGHKNLYEVWKATITKALNRELKKGELFINLASKEYFSAIDTKKLKVPVITPEFKDYSGGELRMVSFFAKKARGMMVRYIIDTSANTIDDIKGFNYEGYAYDDRLSESNNLVFTR